MDTCDLVTGEVVQFDERSWFVGLVPTSLVARDLSDRPAPAAPPVPPGG